MKRKGFTRRQIGAAAALALPALPQEPAKPGDDVEAARNQTRQTAATLRKFKTAASVEPAFVFKA